MSLMFLEQFAIIQRASCASVKARTLNRHAQIMYKNKYKISD